MLWDSVMESGNYIHKNKLRVTTYYRNNHNFAAEFDTRTHAYMKHAHIHTAVLHMCGRYINTIKHVLHHKHIMYRCGKHIVNV